jgi:outer membrane lipoprotein-sorting protein
MKSAEDKVRALINEANIETGSGADERTLADALSELEKMRQKRLTRSQQNVWRIIMKNPITKLTAAAAAIIVTVTVGILQLGSGTVTWAKVVEPILNARTIICDMIIGNDESNPVTHEIIVGSRIRRTMSNMPNMTMVIDLDSANMLVLDSKSKTASYIDIQGDLRDRTQSYVNFLRDIITKMKDNPNIEKLGEQIINGHKAVGFTGRGSNDEVTIWADAKTALPIRIYLRVGQMCAILKNFELDAPIDDSLISMDVPPGYTQKETQFKLSNATEQDFVESLRVWAKVLGDGTFPDAIGTENAMKEMPMLGQKVGKLNLPEEQATQMGMSFGKGMLFHQIIDTRGDDWHYAGSGVKLGDNNKAIFWYRPKDSKTYRVIYGDLHVKDVAPENLPK